MAVFTATRIRVVDLSGRSPRSRDLIQQAFSRNRQRRENNHPILVPGTTPARGSIAERLHWATRYIQLLQFSLGEEGEKPSVRRPERICRTFCISKISCALRSHFVNPERILPCGFQISDNRNSVPVRSHSNVPCRKRQRRGKIHRLFWWFRVSQPN